MCRSTFRISAPKTDRRKRTVRIGWLRSVANIPHAFAVHSFVDELAALADRDRVEYLLEICWARIASSNCVPAAQQNRPNPYPDRYGAVPARAGNGGGAIRAGPRRNRATDTGYGVAVHRSFLSYVATVVEVEVTKDGKLRIRTRRYRGRRRARWCIRIA